MALAKMRYEQLVRETEEKIAIAEMKWFLKYYDDVYENPIYKDPLIKPTDAEEKLKSAIHSLRKQMVLRGRPVEEKKAAEEEEQKKLKPYSSLVPEIDKGLMYPVHPEVRDQLYVGVSHDGQGRAKYLEIRNKLAPEERYYSPMTATHEYGWNIIEKAPEPMKEHCRHTVIIPNFYRRFGAVKQDSERKKPALPNTHFAFDFL